MKNGKVHVYAQGAPQDVESPSTQVPDVVDFQSDSQHVALRAVAWLRPEGLCRPVSLLAVRKGAERDLIVEDDAKQADSIQAAIALYDSTELKLLRDFVLFHRLQIASEKALGLSEHVIHRIRLDLVHDLGRRLLLVPPVVLETGKVGVLILVIPDERNSTVVLQLHWLHEKLKFSGHDLAALTQETVPQIDDRLDHVLVEKTAAYLFVDDDVHLFRRLELPAVHVHELDVRNTGALRDVACYVNEIRVINREDLARFLRRGRKGPPIPFQRR